MGDFVKFLRPAGRARHICHVRSPLFDGLEVGDRSLLQSQVTSGAIEALVTIFSLRANAIQRRFPALRAVSGAVIMLILSLLG